MRVQGESLPLWGTVGQLMDQLTAAGVGERPVVFVCHRHAIPSSLRTLQLSRGCLASHGLKSL